MELVFEQSLVRAVLANRFRSVAFREMRLDEKTMWTLPQGLLRDRRHRGSDSTNVVPVGRAQLGKPFERMQADLTETFPLDDHPVLVPTRKEVSSEHPFVYAERVRTGVLRLGFARLGKCDVNVNLHSWAEPYVSG